jgi:dihydroneopterin aldolase
MADRMTLVGIKALGKHGVFPDEKVNPQDFIVDAVVFLDTKEAGQTDNLEETVSYDEIAQVIYNEIQGPSVNLIETLAERIAQTILKNFPLINEIEITLHKPSAPLSVPFGDISVTITRSR